MGSRFFAHQRAHKHTFTRPTNSFEKRRQTFNQFRPESESLGELGGLHHPTKRRHLCTYSAQLLRATLFVEILWSDLDFWAKLSVENETANLRPFSLTFLPCYLLFLCVLLLKSTYDCSYNFTDSDWLLIGPPTSLSLSISLSLSGLFVWARARRSISAQGDSRFEQTR